MNAHDRSFALQTDGDALGLVGPNTVLQLIEVLRERGGAELVNRIFLSAQLSFLVSSPPSAMIDERIPARLFRALWLQLPAAEAERIAREAGRRTADYIIANRIPGFAKRLLAISPSRLAARLLLHAIAKHAWTFAGSGTCSVSMHPTIAIEIGDNPLSMPDCCWHASVFERLFRKLVSAHTRVEHTACCQTGDRSCRFEIDTIPKARRAFTDTPTGKSPPGLRGGSTSALDGSNRWRLPSAHLHKP